MSARQGTDRHAHAERGDDLYETPPQATQALMRATNLPHTIWEPAAGRGAIARELRAQGHTVYTEDLVAYEGADVGIVPGADFLMNRHSPYGVGAIVTNPPYKLANQFIRHGLGLGVPFYALLRLAALEGAARSDLIDGHLHHVWCGIERLPMLHREGWDGPKQATSTLPYAWFLFRPEKRQGPITLERISWRVSA